MYDNLFLVFIVEFYCLFYLICMFGNILSLNLLRKYVIKLKLNLRCKFLIYGILILK